MEKINCNVIQDILPLYIDDVVSDDTKATKNVKVQTMCNNNGQENKH